MSITQLTDVIIPEVYSDYTAVDSPESTAFFESGVVEQNEMLTQKANTGGDMEHLPFWKDLDASSEPNYSDDSENSGTTQKVQSGKQVSRLAYVNKGYKSADLAGQIAGSDPMQQVRNRFGTYWMRQWQRRLIAASQGVMADNVANDASDMVHDISIEDGNNAAASNLYSRSAFVEAAFTLGDQFEGVTAMGVHSMIAKRMVENDDIDYVADSDGNLTIPVYLGRRVVVDDGLPVIAGGTSGFKYTSMLFGPGAVGYGEGSAKVPVELERKASEGNGGGTEILWERKTWLLHPFGFQWLEGTVAGESATLAELKLAANWNRVIERKNVPIAFLVTNG